MNTLWEHTYSDILVDGKYHYKIQIVDDNDTYSTDEDIFFKVGRDIGYINKMPFYSEVFYGTNFDNVYSVYDQYDGITKPNIHDTSPAGYYIAPPTAVSEPIIYSNTNIGYGQGTGVYVYEDFSSDRVVFLYDKGSFDEDENCIVFKVASQLPIFATQQELNAFLAGESDGTNALNYRYTEPEPEPDPTPHYGNTLWEHSYSTLVNNKYLFEIEIVDDNVNVHDNNDICFKLDHDIVLAKDMLFYSGVYAGQDFGHAYQTGEEYDGILETRDRTGYYIIPPTEYSAPIIRSSDYLSYGEVRDHQQMYPAQDIEGYDAPFTYEESLAEDDTHIIFRIASKLPIFATEQELNDYVNYISDGTSALNYVNSVPVPEPLPEGVLWQHTYKNLLSEGYYKYKLMIVTENENQVGDICYKINRDTGYGNYLPHYSACYQGEYSFDEADTSVGFVWSGILGSFQNRKGYYIQPPTATDPPQIISNTDISYGYGEKVYTHYTGNTMPFTEEESLYYEEPYVVYKFASQLPIFATEQELNAYLAGTSNGSNALNYVAVSPDPPSPNSVIDQFRVSNVLYDLGARAANVGYDNTTSGMQATNLQDAVDTAMAAATSQKTISITPVQLTGTKVADITESRPSSGSISYSLYAPTPIQPTPVIVNDDVATDKLETIQVGDTVYECTAKAEDVSYIGETAGLLADDVQEAIDELAANKANSSDLATVATSGEFSDLLNVPLISDVAYSGDYDDLLNKPSFATVATTGDYSDLNSIPSFATVATTGNYSDLNNTPALAAVATSGSYTDLNSTPNFAAVATTGSYTSLVDKPTIPAAANPNIASAYDSSHTYSIGDYCIYNDLMYVCTTDITAGESFDVTHWSRTDVDAELDKKVKRINYSLTPQKTGIKWIDGTDLYQQTIRMLGTFTGDGEDITVWGQSNLYEEISIAFIKEAFCFDNAGNIITLPYRTDRENNITANVCLNPQYKGLWFRIGPNDTYKDLYVTIWYTKFRLPVTNGLPVGKRCGLGSFVWNDTLTANIIADAKTQDSRIDITGEWMIQYVSAGEGGINVNLYTFDENSGYAYRRYIRTGATSFGINMSDGIGYATDIVWHYFVANDGTLTFNGVEYRFPSMESLQITDTDFVMDNGEICLLPDHAIAGYPIDYSSNINNMLVTTTEYDDQGNYKTIKEPFVRKI